MSKNIHSSGLQASLCTVCLAIVPAAFTACAVGADQHPDADLDLEPIAPPGGPAGSLAETLMDRYRERIERSPFTEMKGMVTTLDGAPIEGVRVRIGGRSALTDKHGEYTVEGVPMGSHVVTFEHEEHVLTQRRVVIEQPEPGWLTQQLLPRSKAHEIDADALSILREGPLTLEIEPGDLEDERDHTPVHGTIEAVVTVVDPRVFGHVLAAPAELEGLTVTGEQVGLFSYGMMEVELWKDGRKVNVRRGQTVKASMDVTQGYEDLIGGAHIPMWHHDEDLGIWVQERGVVAEVREQAGERLAVAELPHFSRWNYDGLMYGACAPIVVPAIMNVTRIRSISCTADGAIDSSQGNYWSVSFDCATASGRSSRCAVNVPAGNASGTYFKLQVQTQNSNTWCDLTLALNGKTGVVWRGSDVNAYLTSNGLPTTGSWCGNQIPTALSVQGDFSFALTQYTLPSNRIGFGTPLTSSNCLATVGANAVSNIDAGFTALASNAATAALSNDYDADGILDKNDRCIAGKTLSQADDNGNGIGEACEASCYVPAALPDASWFDFDGDGVDDLCDNKWSTPNPSQY